MVVPHFFPRVGGVENYALQVARELQSLRWSVVIVTTGEQAGVGIFENMTIYRLRTAFTLSNTPIGFGWRRQLRHIFRVEKPDLINAHTPVPYLADLAERVRNQIPYILTYHNDLVKDFPPYNALLKLVNLTLISRTLRSSSGVIATSDHYRQESPYLRRYRAKTAVVHPGVDLLRFNPEVTVGDELSARYQGRRLIVFVGSLNKSQRHKGLKVLIDSFSRLRRDYRDLCLVVVGAGDGIDMYKAMARTAGAPNEIIFAGHQGDEALAQYYKLATIFAMPSTNRSEGFGMVYMEASAVGVPVIGSRVGGVPYAVKDDETGLLVEPRSVEDLCSALRRLLDDPALARRLGENGAVRASKEFSWSVVAERTSEIFDAVRAAGT
jgi:glycosyltransferase involved in cell wall biosynthesis